MCGPGEKVLELWWWGRGGAEAAAADVDTWYLAVAASEQTTASKSRTPLDNLKKSHSE